MAGIHLNNALSPGLANVVAALEVNVSKFDSSLRGLGGSPYGPKATGNIVSEDFVVMLEVTCLRIGIDTDALMAICAVSLHRQ